MIIVDDASTDDSFSMAKDILSDSRIRILQNFRNVGQARSLNRGLSLVETPFVIQLDGDDILLPNALETLAHEASHQPPGIAVLYANFKTIYEDKEGRTVKSLIQRGPTFKDRYDFILKNKTLRPRFYRTCCLQKIGGWPTGGPFEDRYVEDRRILMRLLDSYGFHWVDELLYVYRKHLFNQTHDRFRCESMKEWIVRDALKRWGDQFEPIFTKNSKGFGRVARLIPKTKG